MDNKDRDSIIGDVPATGQLDGTVAVAGEVTPTDWSVMPVVKGSEDSVVMELWRLLKQEPALIVSAGYVLLSLLGLWSSYFFYLRFNLSILDYLQISDFLVAGLRDPMYAGILAGGIFLAVVLGWPDTLRRRNPARVEALRARHWGWRILFSKSPLTSWDTSGMRPLTGLTIAVVFFMAIGAAQYSMKKAEDIRDNGAGASVTVHLNGDAAPLKEQARLLGSSSAFVFLWWPQQRRAEALPISAIKRLQSVVLPAKPVAAPPVSASRTKTAAE
ncbi:hypothetical protein [Stenotrophomonas sp.]|uniref:hypothetical protein n=1 Tax=Stenotrophomonas sp. TaxID=69392 RepID=UPI00289AB5D6|nr:hypothetical protein [Stenotrophomonas sp.]